ncbi:MAG: hypothetical protein E6H09_03845 [Bacteroidetes bacterium]|nr:MAG: hypothetical protein E6H09_03845 [Bacteroidota bacterium]
MRYRVQRKVFSFIFLFLFFSLCAYGREKGPVGILMQQGSARISFGAQKLVVSLRNAGYSIVTLKKVDDVRGRNIPLVVMGELNSKLLSTYKNPGSVPVNDRQGKEGYTIVSDHNLIMIRGTDASGVLYGCLALADKINETGELPSEISISDQPEMVLRGQCIGLQKSTYLPGRGVYEYPYTPGTFPWFYDKRLWLQVLDSMLKNRMNSLYLWNGHPFASLVRLKDYPFAVEVDDATFKKNEEIYRFLTSEADKRGIWVIQMFYNIIVSKPFAEHYKIKTQDRDRPIIPLIADYTRKSISAFVEKYPNVGLMVCLGEAMEGTGNDDIEWFTKTIIPGVKDGLQALGKTREVPIVLRAHDTDAPAVMEAALPLYKNLYTEAKFNGEALTMPRPRGAWAELHQKLSHLGSIQIENVHIMANLEPFRYGAIDFIQQSVIGMHEVMGGNGLHLYPQASYWDWPYSADSVRGKRLLQIERDWIWYKAWARYAWKAKRDTAGEINYWAGLLASKYGCSLEKGKNILVAYEESGQIAPKLLRRFGITDGNRQTLTLGMLMTQLIDPARYGLFTLLYESESPEGEMLTQYAEKEWKKQSHVGETPPEVIYEVKEHGHKAVAAIETAASSVTRNKEEFERLKNDMYCYHALANHYAAKAEAALYVLRYKYSNDRRDLEKVLPLLQQSVESYEELVSLTKGTYLYANSMQTQQRKIPLRGVNGTYKTWAEVLIPFGTELAIFKRRIDSIRVSHPKDGDKLSYPVLEPADVNMISSFNGLFHPVAGEKVFADTNLVVKASAGSLQKLNAVRLSSMELFRSGTTIKFTTKENVSLLIGYFVSKDKKYLQAPELETNATANEYGQAEIKIGNALIIDGTPAVNVHAYSFGPGTHQISLGKGICLVLGFVKGDQAIPVYDAALNDPDSKNVDWLFE